MMKFGGFMLGIGPLILVLVACVVGWFCLADLAFQARSNESVVREIGPTTKDYETASTWATGLLGLAGTLAGFLGVAAAAHGTNLAAADRASRTEGGMMGILAGATLLGAGGWPVPVALAFAVVGAASIRIVEAVRRM